MGLTRDIARFVTELCPETIPSEVISVIKNAFLDTVGVALAGKNEAGCQIVFDYVKSEGAKPIVTVWGKGMKTSAGLAALANGTMAHALDYDDVNSSVYGHPSTVLVPASLAVAEEINASGRNVVLAYFAGFEVMAYLGKLLGFRHYRKGWHATATLGAIGATVSAGKLYELTEEEMCCALGIATSHAAGTRQNFGTMTKPYHPGYAAQMGIVAAKLAKKGFTANREAIEAPLGFLALYGDIMHPETDEKIGDKVELLSSGISIKKYPCCYMTHRPADAMFKLIEKYNIKADEVDSIKVRAPEGGFAAVIHSRPTTGLEGKFSVEYVLAAVLLDRKLTLKTFTDEMVNREEAQSLLRKVSKMEDFTIQINGNAVEEGFVEVSLLHKNKNEYTERIVYPKGSPQWPLTREELREKFTDCVGDYLTNENLKHTISLFENLDEQDTISPIFEHIS